MSLPFHQIAQEERVVVVDDGCRETWTDSWCFVLADKWILFKFIEIGFEI